MATTGTGTSSYPTSTAETSSGLGSSTPGSSGMSGGMSSGATQADAPASSAIGADAKRMRGDDVLARVVQGAHDTIDRLADSAAPHVQRLSEGMTSANEMVHTRADQVRDMGDEWAESLRCTVRENPLAAVAAALAIGVIIARLTS